MILCATIAGSIDEAIWQADTQNLRQAIVKIDSDVLGVLPLIDAERQAFPILEVIRPVKEQKTVHTHGEVAA
uniref:hypothetical protein n=1 Tax=Halomonas sp. TaxID=1486246 RepID=UPI002625C721|nr:hypothetical protein [Halomonas sp.]